MHGSRQFLDRLGIEVPIIQAPMAGVSTPLLAASASNAGALGSLGIGSSTVAQAQRMIEETRALTDRPFNVNVFCHAAAERDEPRERAWLEHLAPLFAEVGAPLPTKLSEIYPSFLASDETLDLLLERRPAVVSFHFGLPSAERIGRLREAGIITLATATSPREAQLIERAGVDAIVAQGIEAGGHRGMFDVEAPDAQLSTVALVEALTEQSTLPVIAAGGIMDGAEIAAMLDAGAVAAQLGTAFLRCPESGADAAYRARLAGPGAADTTLTPVVSGRPARAMNNRLIEFCTAPGSPRPAAYPLAYDAAKRLHAAAVQHGNFEFAAQWAGQGAPRARELTVAQLVSELHAEILAELRS